MSSLATKKLYSPEDLLSMPDGDRYELEAGNLVERNMSMLSSYIAGVIHSLPLTFCLRNRLGLGLPRRNKLPMFSGRRW
jgi:hypothetical protein